MCMLTIYRGVPMRSGLSERVTFLSTPEFKDFLNSRASEKNISVAELIRRQFQDENNEEEEEAVVLSELIQQVKLMTVKAEKSLDKGLQAIEKAIEEANR